MKTIISFAIILLIPCSQKKTRLDTELSGTVWIHSVYENCTDTIKFISDKEYLGYGCELEDWCYGEYAFIDNKLTMVPKGYWFPNKSEKLSFDEVGDGVEWQEGVGSLKGYILNFTIDDKGLNYQSSTKDGEQIWKPKEDFIYQKIE